MTKIYGYIKIQEVSTLLGVCIMTLRRWKSSNKLKSYHNPTNNAFMRDLN